MIEKNLEVFEPENGFVQTENFAKQYPRINNFILNNQDGWDESRDGKVREILDFKTTLLNPYKRMVGGQKRNINVFFLLAEAMWIFAGHKDVSFLTAFNKKMGDFSDDGNVFHAPYGFRLRHWGVRSEDKFVEENMHIAQGYDQISDAVKIFQNNPNSRQVVLAIWNPDFDLGTITKDIPCNDIVIMKIRNGKLYTTVQNRSNDLHWGLPTNIFQFGFLSEILANVLGVTLGTQTHNSHSLHIYDWNQIAFTMQSEYESGNQTTLYEIPNIVAIPMDIDFDNQIAGNRLREVDIMIERIISNLTKIINGVEPNEEEVADTISKSKWFTCVYRMLEIYLNYKKDIAKDFSAEEKKDCAKFALDSIYSVLISKEMENWDIGTLAVNFFAHRIGDEPKPEILIGKL